MAKRMRGSNERTYDGVEKDGRTGGRFRTGATGSPFHTEKKGRGDVEGAGELGFGMGPGKAANSVKPHQVNLPNKNSGSAAKAGKPGKPYAKGEEE